MKRFAIALSALVAVVSITGRAQAPRVPDIAFESVPNILKLPPDMNLGEVAGVALNSKGHIFIYHRSGHTELLEFNKDGTFIRQIGKDLYGFEQAHVVRIDKDDNIWCVDEGSNMVIKFNPEGHVVMLLGRKWELVEGRPEQPAANAPMPPARVNYFNRPTDVTWDPAGNIYVADGYNNSRVAKFDKNGKWIKAWGTNRRIQVFDTEGTFLKQFTGVEQPWAICITPAPNQVLFSSDANSGKIFKLDLNGTILGAFGSFGKQPKEFGWIHQITCPSANELWVGELLNWRVQKLLLKPGA